MQPHQQFTGESACQGLLQALLDAGCISTQATAAVAAAATSEVSEAVRAAAEAAAAVAGNPPRWSGPYTAASAAEAAAEAAAETAEAEAKDAQQQAIEAAAAAAKAQVQQLQQQHVLKRGAADLKRLLAQAAAAGCPLLLVWGTASAGDSAAEADEDGDSSSIDAASDAVSSGIGSMESVELLANCLAGGYSSSSSSSGSQALVSLADTAASKANQSLAAALHAVPPVVQLYHNNQVVKAIRVTGLTIPGAVAKVHKAVAALSQQQDQQQAQQQVKQVAAVPPGAANGVHAADGDSSSSSATAGSSLPDAAAAADSATSSSIWDPPSGRAAKPGSKQKFPAAAVHGASSNSSSKAVTAVFWPRMPCLDCGCPWWLGEDWDATCARCACVRCGWTAAVSNRSVACSRRLLHLILLTRIAPPRSQVWLEL
jgi:hypothetical protein